MDRRRDDIKEGESNSILSSYNRNFPKRNDGNAATLSFIGSPEIVVAYALAGTLDFNPLTDEVDGHRLEAPTGEELPSRGFESGETGFIAPPEDGSSVEVAVDPNSERIHLLEPFPAWDGKDFEGLVVLMKAVGKCTTDHISAAGPWLRYRGHLRNISKNLFLGVVNAFGSKPGTGYCQLHNQEESLPDIAEHYRAAGVAWVAVGDENYGEGSSREHAAMEPRYAGGKVILVRSFARIHETNLKKQGVLPLTFKDPASYDLIGRDDKINVLGLSSLEPGKAVQCQVVHPDGSTDSFEATHTMSVEHIDWFKSGGALNVIRRSMAS